MLSLPEAAAGTARAWLWCGVTCCSPTPPSHPVSLVQFGKWIPSTTMSPSHPSAEALSATLGSVIPRDKLAAVAFPAGRAENAFPLAHVILGPTRCPPISSPPDCCPCFTTSQTKHHHTSKNNLVGIFLAILLSPQPLASPRELLPASSVITPSLCTVPIWLHYRASLSLSHPGGNSLLLP